ncbi:hypothetical protein DEIPH_ctg092orf0001 [Deinococcus phoenicis]|uniref:Uncharacterized protein n=1 Tax=Deinococcus phoenicis TaxID=1476583 RepID=A0A016QJD5_9DEIO|nr:hypothetical protein DEIPH_ctg145orf0002 [Deinococcus phoenicis]EYB66586.1 hypothetical protein DEIPH_ctg092orf0001 [Deinococcus phoenicis]
MLLVSALLGAMLGAVLAAGGIAGLAALGLFPRPVSGAVLGLLAGLVASGGKAAVTGIQVNGAWARAKAQAEVGRAADSDSLPAPPAPAAPADDWQPASLDDLARTRTDWPAVGLDR